MITTFADQTSTLDISLSVNGVVLPADGGSGSWSLLDASMQPIPGFVSQPLTLAAGATRVPITVSAMGNTKTTDVASRFVRVTWNSGGAQRQTFQSYLLIDWAPVQVTADDARGLIGASRAEIPDTDFDIWMAWLELRSVLGSQEALSRLTSSQDGGRRMNQAIACRAAINVARHMSLRLASRMSSETMTFQRFANLDLPEIIRTLTEQENQLLFPDTAEPEAAPSTFFQLSNVAADVITGG